jgi:hypothetical protein
MKPWKWILLIAGTALIAGLVLWLRRHLDAPEFLDASGPYLGQAPPGAQGERFAPGIVPRDLHSAPVFSPDGQMVVWKAMEGQNRLAYSRSLDGRWTAPRPVRLGLPIHDSDDPAFSTDGGTLYFTSWRPLRWYRPWSHKERIWHAEPRSARWSTPRPLSDAVNETDLHWQFSLTQEGTLYFAAQGDLYRAPVLDGQHVEPVKLPAPVNSELREATPYVAPDERYLIFSSGRMDESQGMDDLYVSYGQADGAWSPAINLGPGVNSGAHELCPRVSPDGKVLFFLSGRSGTYDAYWIDARFIDQPAPTP